MMKLIRFVISRTSVEFRWGFLATILFVISLLTTSGWFLLFTILCASVAMGYAIELDEIFYEMKEQYKEFDK